MHFYVCYLSFGDFCFRPKWDGYCVFFACLGQASFFPFHGTAPSKRRQRRRAYAEILADAFTQPHSQETTSLSLYDRNTVVDYFSAVLSARYSNFCSVCRPICFRPEIWELMHSNELGPQGELKLKHRILRKFAIFSATISTCKLNTRTDGKSIQEADQKSPA